MFFIFLLYLRVLRGEKFLKICWRVCKNIYLGFSKIDYATQVIGRNTEGNRPPL